MTEPQAYARPLRIVAIFVAMAAIGFQLTGQGRGRPDTGLVFHVLRGAQAAIALVVAGLSTPRQSIIALRMLACTLALDIALVTFAVTYLVPVVFWESAAILMAVLLGAAVFAPWSWEWQFGLAVTVVGGTLLLMFLRVPPAIIPAWAVPRLVIVLFTVGAASVVGGYRAQRERDRIAAAEARERAARLEATLEAQRTEIARDIHDQLAQALTALKMDLAWLEKRLPQPSAELARKMADMVALLDRTAVAVQRIATELRPGVLDELGLPAAIEWQAREFQARTGIACKVDLAVNASELDDGPATAAFRILQEALTNVARHASATRVLIGVRLAAQALELCVEDNGRGISDSAVRHPDSLGLLGMRERASNLGGSLRITGVAGRGTTVTLTMPRAG